MFWDLHWFQGLQRFWWRQGQMGSNLGEWWLEFNKHVSVEELRCLHFWMLWRLVRFYARWLQSVVVHFFWFSWKRVLRIINSMNIVDLAESGAFRSWTLERTSSWKVGVLWTQQCHPNGPASSFSCKYAMQETVKLVIKICWGTDHFKEWVSTRKGV